MKEFVAKTLWQEKSIVRCYYLFFIVTLTIVYGRYYLYGTEVSVNEAIIIGVVLGSTRGFMGFMTSLASEALADLGQIPSIILEEAIFFLILAAISSRIDPIICGVLLFLGGFLVIVMILSIIIPES